MSSQKAQAVSAGLGSAGSGGSLPCVLVGPYAEVEIWKSMQDLLCHAKFL